MATFCEEHNLDPDELVEGLDAGVIERVKAAAIEGHHVRRAVQGKTAKL